MTTLRSVVAVATVLMLAPRGFAQTAQEFAFVNMERVFEQYYKTDRADAQLKVKAEEANQAIATLVKERRDLEQEFNTAREESRDVTLSQETRDRRRAEAEELLDRVREAEKEIQTKSKDLRGKLDETNRRMRRRIVGEITEVIATYARQRDFFAVMDSSGPSLNQVPVFLYYVEDADVTDDIVRMLNKDQPAPGEEPDDVEDLEMDDEAGDATGDDAPVL